MNKIQILNVNKIQNSKNWGDKTMSMDENKNLLTNRLLLRRWNMSDAEDLYKYASDPDVGPIAGWPPHQNIEESRTVIRDVFNGAECYAVCLKEDGKAIGAIELKLNGHTDLTGRDDECVTGSESRSGGRELCRKP